MVWRSMGLADIARQDTQETRVQMRGDDMAGNVRRALRLGTTPRYAAADRIR